MVAIAKGSGLFANQNPPHYITNSYYLPIGYLGNGAGVGYDMTATRCYYFPLPIWEAHTFQGASIVNTGAADNGKRIRLMVFNDNGAAGGPGTLAKSFGEITLTGAGAARLLSSSWAATPGDYWGAVWCESGCNLSSMAPFEQFTQAGFAHGPQLTHFMGSFSVPSSTTVISFGHYVATAYGAAPATAVAPNATYENTPGTSAGVGGLPSFWLLG